MTPQDIFVEPTPIYRLSYPSKSGWISCHIAQFPHLKDMIIDDDEPDAIVNLSIEEAPTPEIIAPVPELDASVNDNLTPMKRKRCCLSSPPDQLFRPMYTFVEHSFNTDDIEPPKKKRRITPFTDNDVIKPTKRIRRMLPPPPSTRVLRSATLQTIIEPKIVIKLHRRH